MNKKEDRFGLNKDCFLVKGAKRGAIYDLKMGNVYSVDEHSVRLIEGCETGLTVAEIFSGRSKKIQNLALKCLEELIRIGIGRFLENNESIKKIDIKEPSILDFIWLEIVTSCNLRCIHCYLGDLPVLPKESEIVDWARTIREAYTLGCRKLQFIGGEPFLYTEDLFELINLSRTIGYQFIEVYTNATLLGDDEIQFLADNEIKIAVSIYGPNSEIHDRVTRTPGSFIRTINAVQKLLKKNVEIRVGLVGMSVNENFMDETIKFLKEDIGVQKIKLDIVRPVGRACNDYLLPIGPLGQKSLCEPIFPKCTLEKFQIMFHGHNCFSRKLCVSDDGNVFPCIMERDMILGNLVNSSLKTILQDKRVKKIRGLSKDYIEICRDCEYRYCCFDCRPKAKNNPSANFYAKPSECLYNPYKGKWNILRKEVRKDV